MNILVFLESPVTPFCAKPEQIERFQRQLEGKHSVRAVYSEADFLQALPTAEAVIVWSFRQEWIALAPKLRDIYTPAAGRDYFQITVPRTVKQHYGSFHGKIMGETAVAAILACARGLFSLPPLMHAQAGDKQEAWPRPRYSDICRRLETQTILILGYGSIGRCTAEFLKPFSPRIIGITRRERNERTDEHNVHTATIGELDRYLPQADHVVCFLPSDTGTDHLLDARALALLKPSAYLYNFGRGNCIDEAALCDALRENRLAGAVLDVFQTEPLPMDSPLRSAPNIRLLPHASAFAPDYLDIYFEAFAKEPGVNNA